jgi:hypothetical protein
MVAVLVAWSVMIGAGWVWWAGSTLARAPEADGGLVVLLSGGCCGVVWLAGLVVTALVRVVLR